MADEITLGEEIAALATQMNVATHRLLTCVRNFDESEGWARQGAMSCAHWLTWRIGLDAATAREKVRVARALGTLPRIDEAFAAGKLSYAKVRAVTRIATNVNEERVIEVALAATGAQLEQICRGMKKATAVDSELAAERRIRGRVLGSGLVKLEVVLSSDEADLFLRAIEKARAEVGPGLAAKRASAETPSAPTPGSPIAVAPRPTGADGLVRIAEAFLLAPSDDGEPAGSAVVAARAAPGRDRYEVVRPRRSRSDRGSIQAHGGAG